MKVAIYSRKSKSTDKGESIETQINLCKDYLNKISDGKHIEIVQYDEGEGFSGGDRDRRKFNQLIRDAKSHKYDVLICYRLDRVARSVADFSDLIEELNDSKYIKDINEAIGNYFTEEKDIYTKDINELKIDVSQEFDFIKITVTV